MARQLMSGKDPVLSALKTEVYTQPQADLHWQVP